MWLRSTVSRCSSCVPKPMTLPHSQTWLHRQHIWNTLPCLICDSSLHHFCVTYCHTNNHMGAMSVWSQQQSPLAILSHLDIVMQRKGIPTATLTWLVGHNAVQCTGIGLVNNNILRGLFTNLKGENKTQPLDSFKGFLVVLDWLKLGAQRTILIKPVHNSPLLKAF